VIAVAALLLVGTGTIASGASTAHKAAKTYSLSEIDATLSESNMPTNVTELVTAPEYGVNVSPIDVTGSAAAVAEFAGGTGDMIAGGFDEDVTLEQKGIGNVTIIGSAADYNPWVLVSLAGSKYTSLASLAGQPVGISAIGAVSQYGLYYGLQQASLSTTSINYVALGGAATELAGLQAGTVKAAVLLAPQLQDALAAGTVQIVYDMRTQAYATGVVAVRNSVLATNRAAVCDYMEAYQASENKLFTDPTWALDESTLLYGAGVSPADLKVSYTANRTIWQRDDNFPESLYTSTKAILLDAGFSATGFPTYQQLTQNRPTHIVVKRVRVKVKGKETVKSEKVREAC
jgi:ABC-type nitrate/sulfonate/bicarbonate transport system substrate-binding protein